MAETGAVARDRESGATMMEFCPNATRLRLQTVSSPGITYPGDGDDSVSKVRDNVSSSREALKYAVPPFGDLPCL